MKKIFLILVMALFILSSCKSNNVANSPIKEIDFHTGTEGLVVDFVKGNPSDIVYVSSGKTDFYSAVSVENKGAYSVKNGYMNLLVEKGYVDFSSQIDLPQKFALEGKSTSSPDGGYLEGAYYLNGILDTNSASKKTQISALVCYEYETQANANVCIDPDTVGRKTGQKICTVSDQSFSGQGGPVVVTRIETRMIQKESSVIPSFMIYISNKGNGQVLNADLNTIQSACGVKSVTVDKDEMWNVVQVEASLGLQKLDCATDSKLHFKNKEDFIKCELTSGIDKEQNAYLSSIQINLKYGYTYTKSKTVELKRI